METSSQSNSEKHGNETGVMMDCNNTILEKGDVVYYRDRIGQEFNKIGMVYYSNYVGGYIGIVTNTHMIIDKLPKNLVRMPDEKAMLWKLENR